MLDCPDARLSAFDFGLRRVAAFLTKHHQDTTEKGDDPEDIFYTYVINRLFVTPLRNELCYYAEVHFLNHGTARCGRHRLVTVAFAPMFHSKRLGTLTPN